MKAVLDTKPDSGYDDEISRRYHFPSNYLEEMSRCEGDWVVFHRTRASGGTIAYFGVGMVVGIEPDQDTHGHHYAYIGNYLPFDSPVPWRRNGRYAEAHLRELQEKQATYTVGRSIRIYGG